MLGSEQGAQYFARYAEPEAKLAAGIADTYACCLVIPLCGEAIAFLAGFRAALERAAERVLVVLVVNAPESASEAMHTANMRLLADLNALFPTRTAIGVAGVKTRGALAREQKFDLVWLDRASPGMRLPEREGVGMARKIGGDFAVALWAQGRLTCPRIACSDADVTLPNDYFASLVQDVPERALSSAWLWPFRHEAGDDVGIDEATVLYEISLRYYVLGLAAAKSPYAYQSVGSTLCVDARAYLSVRGFPKRAAGEDFYALDKLAKVLPLRRVVASPLRIRARASARVPFGTGRRSREIAEERAAGGDFLLYAPEAFRALAAVITGLDEFAESANVRALRETLLVLIPEQEGEAHAVLDRLGVFDALHSAARGASAGPVLRRRIHTWFDALRTLRFIHGIREACFPSLPWRTALANAEFLSAPFRDGEQPSAVCGVLAELEAELPAQVGPALL